MHTATLIKNVEGFTGDARLYRLIPPMKYEFDDENPQQTEFVVVSATVGMFGGPETYIFPADESGNVLDYCELDGSFRGGLNHSLALSGAGYKVL